MREGRAEKEGGSSRREGEEGEGCWEAVEGLGAASWGSVGGLVREQMKT